MFAVPTLNFITEKSACQENVYTKIEFQRTVDDSGRTLARLACLCTSGRLLVFKNILLLNGDLDLSLVTMDRLESAHMQAFDFISTEMSIVTVGSGADCLAVYTFENSTFCLSQTASLEFFLRSIQKVDVEEIWLDIGDAQYYDSIMDLFQGETISSGPGEQLQYLLSRRRFDEAEMLAKLHGLHFVLEPVFVQQRLREPKETFEETRQHIAKCKVQLLENKSRDEMVAQILSEISDMERRLEAYARVFGENHFSTKVWAIFQVEEPAVLFEELLLREAERAFIFWECFKDDLVLLLKPLKIRMILNSIPSQVPCVNTRDWLINWVIPFMIPRDPDAVTAVIEWTEQQVSVMEATNKKSWSTDAINFCQIVLENLELVANCDIHSFDPAMLMTVKSKFSCASLLTPLRDLIKCLHWLDDLCTKYNYNIGLEALKKDLLDRSAGCTMHYLVIEKMKAFIRLIGSLKVPLAINLAECTTNLLRVFAENFFSYLFHKLW
uniref:KNTC1 first ARM-repeats domain-containing protein n=1 Tax=Biomphalaria glabrata TaxID=6526 RepID=A0A2C9LN50_BIOGL